MQTPLNGGRDDDSMTGGDAQIPSYSAPDDGDGVDVITGLHLLTMI